MNKQFAIFDMDGTLVDSMVFWKRLGREYLELKGIRGDLDDVMERIKPMTMSESAKLFVEEFSLDGTPKSVETEMNEMMDAHYREDIPLKPGVREYLELLHTSRVKMCVASATAEKLMTACLSRLGVAQYFQFFLSCETVGVGKREPDVYFEAAKRLGALPENIAVYEDALYASRTAKQAGFYTIGVFDDSSKRHWEQLCGLADEVICDWSNKGGEK